MTPRVSSGISGLHVTAPDEAPCPAPTRQVFGMLGGFVSTSKQVKIFRKNRWILADPADRSSGFSTLPWWIHRKRGEFDTDPQALGAFYKSPKPSRRMIEAFFPFSFFLFLSVFLFPFCFPYRVCVCVCPLVLRVCRFFPLSAFYFLESDAHSKRLDVQYLR